MRISGLSPIASVAMLAIAVLPVSRALAQSNFVLGDGLTRAPAVTLACPTGAGATVAGCGGPTSPLVVTGTIPGSSTAANQQAQTALLQGMVSAVGTPGDVAGSSTAPSSIVALLKTIGSLLSAPVTVVLGAALPVGANMIGQVAPAAGGLTSRTVQVPAGQSTMVFLANPSRRYLSFQAPQTTFIWVNRMGGTAVPNGPDCFYFPSGALFESGSFVSTGGLSVYAPTAVQISAVEG